VTRIIATRQTGIPKASATSPGVRNCALSQVPAYEARHVNHNKIVVALARELSALLGDRPERQAQ